MNNSKLTLSVKSDSIDFVKKYAKRQQTSVSKLVESFFDEIALKEEQFEEKLKSKPISPQILALTGIIKDELPENFDYRDAYREHLNRKHGL
jgi:hypothetical protein